MSVPNIFYPGEVIAPDQMNENFATVVAGIDALTGPTGSADIGFTQAGTGAVTRTAQAKMRDVVSVKDFGAVGDGVTDDTAAIQAALDSGALGVFIPQGVFAVSSVVMPNVFGFTLYGSGTGSKIQQRSGGAGALIRWDTAAMVYNEQTVSNFAVVGTNGSQDCIDTTGAGGVTLRDIFIRNVPTGKSGVVLDGAAGVYAHDARVINLQVYSNTAGFSAIKLGSLNSDCFITNFIVNGNFVLEYSIYADNGALTTSVADSHIYNNAVNVVRLASNNNNFMFNGVTIDNSLQDSIVIQDGSSNTFTGCFLQMARTGYNNISVMNTSKTVVTGCIFSGEYGAISCFAEDTTSNYNIVSNCQVSTYPNYTTLFELHGASSTVRAVPNFVQGVFGAQGKVDITSYGTQINFTKNGYNYVTANASSAVLRIQTTGLDGSLAFATRNTERGGVTSDGRWGIGTTAPADGAILDVQSTAGGVRFPNMTSTQKNAITPSAGTVVFDTTLGKLSVYAGSGWQTITST